MSGYWEEIKNDRFFVIVNGDSCKDAKEHYIKVYGKESNIRFNNGFSGECDFNFNNVKYDIFKKIIDNDKNVDKKEKESLIEELKNCYKMHHSLLNISLIFQNGGMNSYKGTRHQQFDRLDFFVFKLNEYFTNNYSFAFLPNHNQNTINLIEYLSDFDIHSYCEQHYFIKGKVMYEGDYISSNDFIVELIENGKKKIENAKDISNYIRLAKIFWLFKLKHYISIKDN